VRLHPEVELRMVCAPTSELRPLLHRRQIEMALVSLPDPAGTEVIRRGKLRLGRKRSGAGPCCDQASLPLALSAPMTLDYRAACDAMEAAGRRYSVAFASNSLAGLIAIARSGHAISVLTQTAVPPDLHIVSAGLPLLPAIGIALEFASCGHHPPRALWATTSGRCCRALHAMPARYPAPDLRLLPYADCEGRRQWGRAAAA
jgi:DNA-binding transcriptional LysR family regulator